MKITSINFLIIVESELSHAENSLRQLVCSDPSHQAILSVLQTVFTTKLIGELPIFFYFLLLFYFSQELYNVFLSYPTCQTVCVLYCLNSHLIWLFCFTGENFI